MTKSTAKEIIARYTSHGHRFEILVDPNKAKEYKQNGDIPARDVMIGDYIFTDISKADRAKDDLLISVFKTSDVSLVAEQIIKRGEIQLTAEQRKEAFEQKKNRIVSFISRHAVDPKTKLPHPPKRIETALAEAKVRIDPQLKAKDQIKDIIKQLRPIIPLSIENRTIAFKIPVKYGGTVKSAIAKSGNILKEEWRGQYWLVETELPAGMLEELFNEVNSITHGENESKILPSKL
ncbi:MAG: ribosome assembly factor SBDS [Candidatus Aenigmarchaeota archaeon]|nr:ribosome assembly factor SBDS [Candidatus Aenigmarchaeota archaeon]